MLGVFLNHSSMLSFETRPLAEPEDHQLSKQAQGSSPSVFSVLGLQAHATTLGFT